MTERADYPHGVPSWVTAIVADPEAAAGFYADRFGWECVQSGGFLTARLRGRDVAAIAPPPRGVTESFWVTHVSADPELAAERARAAGGRILAEPFEEPRGRITVVADPEGAVFSAGTRAGAQLVDEPGAWAISQLATQDLDAAAAFYGAVFGWTTEPLGPATLFRNAGELVALMVEGNPGERGWIPDFRVDDVDAATAGATIVTGPYDIPGAGRQAVLADPCGAVFSVSAR